MRLGLSLAITILNKRRNEQQRQTRQRLLQEALFLTNLVKNITNIPKEELSSALKSCCNELESSLKFKSQAIPNIFKEQSLTFIKGKVRYLFTLMRYI
jgi:hypothetical protein